MPREHAKRLADLELNPNTAIEISLYDLACLVECSMLPRDMLDPLVDAIVKRAKTASEVCTCHERDSSYVCDHCYKLGYRGHMQGEVPS